MKTVVNAEQVAHLWANQSQAHARNGQGNFYFEGPAIYSYRRSWPLAVFTPWRDEDGAHVVVLNTQHYGNTTTRHLANVRRALRGHDVALIEATSSMDESRLANGDANALDNVLGVYAARVLDHVEKAASRRDPDYFAYDIRAAREAHTMALRVLRMASGGKPVSGKSSLAALASMIPRLPDYLPAADVLERGDEHAAWYAGMGRVMSAYRAARSAAEAHGRMARLAKDCAADWKTAKANADTGNVEGAAKLLRSVENQLTTIKHVAKAHKIAIPRGVPSLAATERLRAKILPRRVEAYALAAAESADRYARAVVAMDAERKHSRHTEGSHNRRTRLGNDPAELARVLVDGGYSRACKMHMVPMHSARRVASRFIIGDVVAGMSDEIATVSIYDGRDAAARAAKAKLRAAYVHLAAVIDALQNRITRAAARGHLENLIYNVRKQIDNAGNIDDVRTWEVARGAVKHYRDAREKYAELAGGLPFPSHFITQIANLEREAVARDAAHTLRGFDAMPARDDVAVIREALASGRPYQAAGLLESLAARAANIQKAAVVMAGDSSIFRDDSYMRARIARRLENLQRDIADVRPYVEAAERDSVSAWRARDPHAPRPSGYYFRLSADGQEIESSGGARVSIQAGRRLWAMIRRCTQRGESMAWAYGEGPHVGPFRLQSIGADGSAVVGCHAITAGEARAFADHMQWPPFGSTTTEDDNAELEASA